MCLSMACLLMLLVVVAAVVVEAVVVVVVVVRLDVETNPHGESRDQSLVYRSRGGHLNHKATVVVLFTHLHLVWDVSVNDASVDVGGGGITRPGKKKASRGESGSIPGLQLSRRTP